MLCLLFFSGLTLRNFGYDRISGGESMRNSETGSARQRPLKAGGRQTIRKTEIKTKDRTTAGLKTAMFVIPLVIIAVMVIALIIGINQYSSMFASSNDKNDPINNSDAAVYADDEELLLLISPDSPLKSDYRLSLTVVDGISVDRKISADLEAMLSDAADAGLSIRLTTGYVSAEIQRELFMNEVRRLIDREGYSEARAMEEAEKTVPMENHSEFQSGLAVRFTTPGSLDFSLTDEYHWLMRNAANYGFVLRYPEGKEYETGFPADMTHFRYVGRNNAIKMKTLNMCLDEYVYYLDKRS